MTLSPGDGSRNGYALEQGTAAVRLARAVVESSVRKQSLRIPEMDGVFDRPSGVFTTLSEYPSGKLRGCIGFAEPVFPLRRAIVEASRAAALEDSRFRPVEPGELERLVVEVSLLTPPAELKAANPEDRSGVVEVGRHGLVVRWGRTGGLLLPQVAVEWGWTAQEFLEQTCKKAGLPPDAWRDRSTRVLAFEAAVFAEESPGGAVLEHGAPGGPATA